MISIGETNSLEDINDTINDIGKDFRAVRALVRRQLPALLRAIKRAWPQFPKLGRLRTKMPIDIPWDIKLLLEENWAKTEFVKPPTDINSDCVYIEQIAAMIHHETRSPARKQGLRLVGRTVHEKLLDSLYYSDQLLWNQALVPDDKKATSVGSFSAFRRFWQRYILAQHGVVGVTVAFLMWEKYLASIFPLHARIKIREQLATDSETLPDELIEVVYTLIDQSDRCHVTDQLLLLGTFCYRHDLDDAALKEYIRQMVLTTIAPYLWGVLHAFGNEELGSHIDRSLHPIAPPETLLDEQLLTLIMMFHHLDWDAINETLGLGTQVRSKVAEILGNCPAVVRMGRNPHLLSNALQQAQDHGLIPEHDFSQEPPTLFPHRTLNSIDKGIRVLSR